MSDKNVTLVTGAGGFIGGWLAETLYLKGGTQVRAGVHSWPGATRPARFPMDIVLCDMMNLQQVNQSMDGVKCVIHCARGADHEIAQGARNLLEAASRHGVERFVHVSTTEVFGNQTGKIDDTFPCQSMGDPYGDGKIEAEEICREYNRKGLPVVIIRPPIVYGPFSKIFTVNIASKLMSGNWGLYQGVADGICNLVYASDLVSGIIQASKCKAAIGETFILNGHELITWNQYFQKFNNALGLPELKVFKSETLKLTTTIKEPIRSIMKYMRYRFEHQLKSIAAKQRQARQIMKFVENRMKTTPRVHDLHLFGRQVTYQDDKARDILGYQPTVTLEEGLRLSAHWLEQVGLVNSLQTTRSDYPKVELISNPL
ncbi:MAG: NAD-dependent epimerase/dehydratase family protein [Chloroflexi bacterium]|nr:NAD-dependent epimerase/dehydratase family protein [Chloroflexota bacterium]